MSSKLKDLLEPPRLLLGVLGAIAWLTTFRLHEYALAQGWEPVAHASTGYMLGYASAFSGWVASQVYDGNLSRLVDPHPFWKVISIGLLALLCAIGLIGGFIDFFRDTSLTQRLSFWIGAFVMGVCTSRVVQLVDGP